MPLALALDVGTTSIAAVAVSEDGRLVADIQMPNDAGIAGLPTGYAEQNPLRIREVACDVLRQLAAALPEPAQCLGMYAFYDGAGICRLADVERIIGSGNGLRKNPRLVREISRRFGRPVWFPAHSQEAAYGAALLAGASTGLWPDLETASQNIRLIEQ